MSLKVRALPHAVAQIIASGAFSAMVIAPAMAQQVGSDPQSVQRVEITGSNIRRVDAETPSPVQVITADDMKKSGFTSVADVLQHITANGQGTLSQGFPQAFAAGASGISLRGLTTSATLVLIDGHRMASYPLSDDGQRSFVDISNIPFDTVERIEILKDGASAIYGSDAMAGVVNIILKKNFVGTTLSAESGDSTEGGGTTSHASIIHGFGDYDTDGYNAYVSLEARHQDSITYNQRAGDGPWQNLNWAPLGGVNRTPGVITPQNPTPATLTPYLTNPNVPFSGAANSSYFYPGSCGSYATLAAGSCAYQNPNAEISPRTQNINFLASFTKKLNDGWKLDVKASLFDSKAEQFAPGGTAGGLQTYPSSFNPLTAVSAGNAPTSVGSTISAITVPANYPGNPFGVPALVNGVIPGAPAPNTQIESKATRVVADLTGTIGAWDIDTSIGYTKVTTSQNVYGGMNVVALNAALNRPVNPFMVTGGNSAADMAAIFPTMSAYDVSELDFAELHATRELMTLPGGDLGFSTGGEFIRRSLNSPAPDLIAQGIISGNNAYVSGSQTDSSVYAEVDAPVLKTLEVDITSRFDHFNNAGNATTSKLGFKWTPSNSFALRGTVAQGFRAPNPAENGQSGSAYQTSTTYDPVLCPGGTGSGNIPRGSVVAACNYQPLYLNSSNPNLSPEKSLSETLGVILEPIKGWSTTVDLYQINIKNQIVEGTPSTTPVRGAPVQSLCADGNGGTYTCTPNVGPVLYYPNDFINANSTKTSGIEYETRYKFKLGNYGSLTTDLQWSHTMSYVLTVGGDAYQLAGTHGPYVIGGDTGNPKDKVQATFTWDKGALQVATTFNWTSSFSLTDPSFGLNDCGAGGAADGWFPSGNTPAQYCKVASFLETDLSARYKLNKNWTLHGSINNLFNRQAPVDLNTYGGGQLPYNPSMQMSGAIGRFFNVGASYSF